MRHIESRDQRDVVSWARAASRSIPELTWLHSSLNGVKIGNIRQAQILKAEGMKGGVCDLFLPLPRWVVNDRGERVMSYAGLYIEMKRRKIGSVTKGRLSEAQKDFIDYANQVGYKAIVCYGAEEAIRAIMDYLKLPCSFALKLNKN